MKNFHCNIYNALNIYNPKALNTNIDMKKWIDHSRLNKVEIAVPYSREEK